MIPGMHIIIFIIIRLEGTKDPQFRRSHDLAHASTHLAQTPWGLTERTWLLAGAQWVVIMVLPPLKSLGIDSRYENSGTAVAVAPSLSPSSHMVKWALYSRFRGFDPLFHSTVKKYKIPPFQGAGEKYRI